ERGSTGTCDPSSRTAISVVPPTALAFASIRTTPSALADFASAISTPNFLAADLILPSIADSCSDVYPLRFFGILMYRHAERTRAALLSGYRFTPLPPLAGFSSESL